MSEHSQLVGSEGCGVGGDTRGGCCGGVGGDGGGDGDDGGEGEGGAGSEGEDSAGAGEGEGDATVARSTGSHCGRQATPRGEGRAFEPRWPIAYGQSTSRSCTAMAPAAG